MMSHTPITPTRRHWSPEPEPSAKIDCFRHNPYSFAPVTYGYTMQAVAQEVVMDVPAFAELPEGTRHVSLWGRVSFAPFPGEAFQTPMEAIPRPDEPLVRVFLGQLPYFITDMELNWMTCVLGGGYIVVNSERIMKRQSGGDRLPTGCIHAYATRDAAATLAANMHKRMLVDDTGVWIAHSDDELHALSAYIAEMKSDKSKRVPGRPYDSIVVQEATSTFVPACPVPLTEFPTERPAKPQYQRMSPPPYNAYTPYA